MFRTLALAALAAAAAVSGPALAAAPAGAPAPPPNYEYGPSITLEQAMQVMAAAHAEMTKRGAKPSIAIVDPAGELVYFEKSTGAAYNAPAFAMGKAKAAARLKRPSKYDFDRLNAGNVTIQFLPDAFPFVGGYPILSQGKVIGGIGVTGGADEEVAQAAIAALK